MFSHYVKASAESEISVAAKSSTDDTVLVDFMKATLHLLKGNQNFYIEKFHFLDEIISLDLEELVDAIHGMHLSLPFKNITISYRMPVKSLKMITVTMEKGLEKSERCIQDGESIPCCDVITALSKDLVLIFPWLIPPYIGELRKHPTEWGAGHATVLACLSGSIKNSPTLSEIYSGETLEYLKTVDAPIVTCKTSFDLSEYVDYAEAEKKLLTVLFKFLYALNTKGVQTERIAPSSNLNKKRVRNNKPELLEYHVLKIAAEKKSYSDSLIQGYGGKKRLHLCRGHIKHYTAEKPLFRHFIGPIWVDAHVRGDKKTGLIGKDYVVV